MFGFLFRNFSQNRHPVAEGKDGSFDSIVIFYKIVKSENSLRLGIINRRFFGYLAAPQCVVGNNNASDADFWEKKLVIIQIFSFVGINKYQIEGFIQRLDDF